MDTDRIKGAAEQAKGKVREVFGKLTQDAKKAATKAHETVGAIKDKVKETTQRK
ncbi:MAG: CsbD family protein [Bradyrhizobiaceae bacterium]|nr:CsbD family protein [Bradyrhizobiaceae bacterium]